jgi:hypothetical protein
MADDQVEFDTDEEEVSIEIEETASNEDGVILTESGEADEFDKAQNATQKRINQLTKKMRQAEREKDEAVRYAQTVQGEANTLKARVDELDSGYVNEFSGRVQSLPFKRIERLRHNATVKCSASTPSCNVNRCSNRHSSPLPNPNLVDRTLKQSRGPRSVSGLVLTKQ